MSLYHSSGRYKLACWLFHCLKIDLVLCGLYVLFNFTSTYNFLVTDTVGTGLAALVFCFYVAILDTVRQKILEYGDNFWKIISELIASLYCFLHAIVYILIIGSIISVIYQQSAGVPFSSDFLMSWSIILAALIIGIFYLKNRKTARYTQSAPESDYTGPLKEYTDIPVTSKKDYPDEDSDFKVKRDRDLSQKDIPSRSYESACFICGKSDAIPQKGKDGRYYCQDHILLANQIFLDGYEQSLQKTGLKGDTQCFACGRYIHHKDAIKCGPCEKLFCARCWESHRWIHGTAPAMGISYHANGKYSGYDGSERYRK